MTNLTTLLDSARQGDKCAEESLYKAVLIELKKIAKSYMRRERDGHTLQPTALVNEAYLRLIDIQDIDWKNRAHFFAIAATTMRRILVDHARAKQTGKRAVSMTDIPLERVEASTGDPVDLLNLEVAMEELASLSSRQAKIVECKFYGGLSLEEIAAALEISLATVKRDWAFARAWLYNRLLELNQ